MALADAVSYEVSKTCDNEADCLRSLATGSASGFNANIPMAVQSLFPSAFLLSASADAATARLMGSNAGSDSHILSWNEHSASFTDSNIIAPMTLSADQITGSMSAILGDGVSFNAETSEFVIVLENGSESRMELSKPAFAAFFNEMFSLLSALAKISPRSGRISPDVITLSISTYRNALRVPSCSCEAVMCPRTRAALSILLARFVTAVKAESARIYGGKALVQVVTLSAGDFTVSRRDTNARTSPVNYTPNPPVPVIDGDFDWTNVPYCTEYQCYCNKDSNGIPWSTGANGVLPGWSVSCGTNATCNNAVWFGCPCNSTYVQNGTQSCSACATAYVLYNGYCYVDSDYPVTFNIVLWLGLAITIGLLVCSSRINTDHILTITRPPATLLAPWTQASRPSTTLATSSQTKRSFALTMNVNGSFIAHSMSSTSLAACTVYWCFGPSFLRKIVSAFSAYSSALS